VEHECSITLCRESKRDGFAFTVGADTSVAAAGTDENCGACVLSETVGGVNFEINVVLCGISFAEKRDFFVCHGNLRGK
jgi:hypothetical protein